MLRLKNLSIKLKVALVAAIGFLALVVYMLEVNKILHDNNVTLSNIHNSSFPIIQKLTENRKSTFSISDLASNAIAQNNIEFLKQSRYYINDSLTNFDDIVSLDNNLDTRIKKMRGLLNEIDKIGTNVAEGKTYETMSPEEIEDRIFEMEDISLEYIEKLENAIDLQQKKLKDRLGEMLEANNQTMVVNRLFGITIALILVVISYLIVRQIRSALINVMSVADRIANGDLTTSVNISARDETGHLLTAIETMRSKLKQQLEQEQKEQFIQAQMVKVNESLRGNMDINELGNKLLATLASAINIHMAILYCFAGIDEKLSAVGTFAIKIQSGVNDSYAVGDSLVGQCALMEKQMLVNDIPDHYMNNQLSFGKFSPNSLLLIPIHYHDSLVGVMELGSYNAFTSEQLEFISAIRESIGIAINSAKSKITNTQDQSPLSQPNRH